MTKRRTHSPEFKARVATEAISSRKTLQKIAADHAIHPIQVSQWKQQPLEGAGDLFSKGREDKEQGDLQSREAELFQEIGRLKIELECLKISLRSSAVQELRRLVDLNRSHSSVPWSGVTQEEQPRRCRG